MLCLKNAGVCSDKPNFFGGTGTPRLRELFQKGDYRGQARIMGVFTLEPGSSVGEHTHQNDEELVYILKGSCDYSDNGEPCTLQAGDAALTRGGESHALCNNGTEDLEYLVVVLTY